MAASDQGEEPSLGLDFSLVDAGPEAKVCLKEF